MSHADYAVRGLRQMQSSDLIGGTIEYQNIVYLASIGTFSIRQELSPDGGGFSPMLLGDATVAREDLPDGTELKRGTIIVVRPAAGPERICRVHSFNDMGALLQIILEDTSEAA